MAEAGLEVRLLCEPYLVLPDATGVEVSWLTDASPRESRLVVAPASLADRLSDLSAEQLLGPELSILLPDATAVTASSVRLPAMAEDRESVLPARLRELRLALEAAPVIERQVWRQAARATELDAAADYVYRVVSSGAASSVARLRPSPAPDAAQLRLLLTSDHQLGTSVPAAMEQALAVAGPFDAVVYAGDFVNVPDRASEWFDDARGSAFFPSMRGILPSTPIFPVPGNHEVQGRRARGATLAESFAAAVPRSVCADGLSLANYEALFPTRTGSRSYAVTFGGIRIVALSATRVWRSERADAHPDDRLVSSRYQEARAQLAGVGGQRFGSHIIDDLTTGSEQHEWLRQELASPAFAAARLRVVVMHESPHSIGVNAMPHFAHPVRIEEHDTDGELLGVRYDYPSSENILLRDVAPLLEASGVDLVIGGHSHLWSRFTSSAGVHYLETSHAGSTHGAFVRSSGRQRARPPAPWNVHDAVAQGDPGGLDAVTPTIDPRRGADGQPLPYVADPGLRVFSVLTLSADEGAAVASYVYDTSTPEVPAHVFDEFRLGGSLDER